MTGPRTLELTAQIVSAHVGKSRIKAEQLPDLIRDVFDALSKAGQLQPETKVKEPVVPVKKSVFDDHIVCLECGTGFKMLKRHLRTEHNLTPGEYHQRFALPWDYPLVAPAYAQTRAKIAESIGLGHYRQVRKVGRKRS